MLSRPPECRGCPLDTLGSGFSHPTGSCSTGVLMLGEALGATEAQKGVPFVGEAGAQLNRTLSRTPWTRDDFRLYNVLQCQPPKNWLVGAPWEEGAIEHCVVHRNRIIAETVPKAILCLGGTALKAITGNGEILKKRGYVWKVPLYQVMEGVEHQWAFEQCYLIGTYHPSYIMQGNQNLTGIQAFDISRAVEVAKNGWEWTSNERYVEHPSLDQIDEFINKAVFALSAGAWLTADIETARSVTTDEDERMDVNDPITRISFAFEPGYAITIPWQADYLSRIQDILSLSQQYLVFWNADFDVPRLKAHGMTIRQKVVDAMYMWHFLQSDLPKSLGFVASIYTKMPEWKSMSYTAPEYYSCCDADAQIRCTNGIVADLKKQGRFDMFMRHHTELQPILNEMGQSGVLLDQEKRKEFRSAIEEDRKKVDGEIQKSVPVALRPFRPRARVGAVAQLGEPCRPGSDATWGYDPDTGEWGEDHPFLYNSPQQVLKYIRSQGHAVPRNYKTGKDTTGKDDLESLAKRYPKDPVYRRIIEARELHKVIGQYIDGYVPGPDGRVRTTFTQKPSTWRLASESPNVQNVRRRWHLANRYREQFVAAPGHVLCEVDYRAIEAVLTGWFAQDQDYIRAAKLGVHSILAAHILQHPLRDLWAAHAPEDEVLAAVRDIKRHHKDIYDKAKTIVHLSNYKGSARRIKIEYPDLFGSVAEAEKLQRLYFANIATKVEAWHTAVVAKAAGQSYLENPFCVGPNTKVLMQDLTWKIAERLRPGDKIIGFSEDGPKRVYEPSTVLATEEIQLPRVLVTTDRGSILISQDHCFLVQKPELRRFVWKSANQLKPGDKMAFLAEPWDTETSWEAGYLAAIFDGEGSLSFNRQTGKYFQQSHLQLAQKAGIVLDKTRDYLQRFGFQHTLKSYRKPPKSEVWSVWLRGGLREKLRFLGSIRPYRLLQSPERAWLGHRVWGNQLTVVQEVMPASTGPVISTKTSTATLITEGFLSHNCYRHYFYDVLRYDGTYGTDAKKALAFLPQSTAAAIIKEAILRLAAKEVYRRAMRWQIHDALLFELPNDRLLDARIGTIVAEMTRPIPQLNGLSIDVEVTVGENWGSMKEWKR